MGLEPLFLNIGNVRGVTNVDGDFLSHTLHLLPLGDMEANLALT